MSKQTFAERCQLAQQLLPDAQYRAMLTALHAEMLEALAEQSAQQEPVAYGMWDTMLGKDNRMMMVRLDNGQDGCTVPLYTTPPAQPAPVQEPVAWRVKVETKLRDGSVDVGYQLRNSKLSEYDEPLYTTPQAQPAREPLTDEQIADYLGDEYHIMTEEELRFFKLGEQAAHGITKGNT